MVIKEIILMKEIFKLKNWYGNTVNYINNFENVSVLDIGCGLDIF